MKGMQLKIGRMSSFKKHNSIPDIIRQCNYLRIITKACIFFKDTEY